MALLSLTACSSSSDETSGGGGGASPEQVVSKLKTAGLPQVAKSLESAVQFEGKLEDGTPFKIDDRILKKVESGQAINYVFSYQSTSVALLSYQLKSGYDASLPLANEMLPLKGKALAPSAATDTPAQIAQVQALLDTNQIDCLSIQQADLNAMNQIRDQALAKGIPVFMVNVESNGAEISQFRQDRTKEGVGAANTLIEWIKETGTAPKKIALSSGEPSAAWSTGRLNGFVDTLKKAYPDITFANTPQAPLKAPYDPAQAYDAYKAFLTGNTDVDFIVNADLSIEQAARAINDLGRTGKIHTLGWNPSEGQFEAIEKGTQVASLDQGWPEHGGFGAVACASLLGRNLVMQNTQEPGVITRANLDEARAALKQAS
ncbi:sugar ABC transporter substrate-binding protein [Micromonospora sp. NPDC049051]|uniref:sugar ABC transporter substrate-binding protein n=1 Tax=unclassified Micromonospora TaxID=2617518 RepID=UPI003719AF9B